MAVTPFVAVQWQPLDLIDETKMDDMANAISWVQNNTPRARAEVAGGGVREQNLRIAAGRVQFPRAPNKHEAAESVNFGGFFNTGCRPLITTGIQSKLQQNIGCTFQGFDDKQIVDHRGMRINIEILEQAGKSNSKNKIQRTFQVHWIAMGW